MSASASGKHEECYSAGKVFGLTGGVGTGKSTVTEWLRALYRLPVIDADEVARQVVEPGTLGYWLLRMWLGRGYFRREESATESRWVLDRSRVAQRVFADAWVRFGLNALLRPLILSRIVWRLFLLRYVASVKTPILLDAPLLFESRLHWICAVTLVVYCRADQQRERLRQRHPEWSDAEIEQRIRAQWPLERKLLRADVRVDNCGERVAVRERVVAAYTDAQAIARRRAKRRENILFGVVAIALLLVFSVATYRGRHLQPMPFRTRWDRPAPDTKG
ncbi:hypothetical protein CDCA_CDCA13G3571 [Cyanidium caldarium]|uniref:Dephospho-CoA kinase n=1 Tax=Cyanidium caldarium TaxID=2771 RepID=A0AAV9IZJ1_CYACA|nr:hypothetical protein CDCA_CDCA13G3571 [Cyanidium caldarium]